MPKATLGKSGLRVSRYVVGGYHMAIKGEEIGIMDDPPITVYMQTYDDPRADRLDTSGYWRTAKDFPVPHHSERRLYFCADGLLNAHEPDYDGEGDKYIYDPTVGLCGGLWSAGVPFGLPTDQRPDEIHALTYTSGKTAWQVACMVNGERIHETSATKAEAETRAASSRLTPRAGVPLLVPSASAGGSPRTT